MEKIINYTNTNEIVLDAIENGTVVKTTVLAPVPAWADRTELKKVAKEVYDA